MTIPLPALTGPYSIGNQHLFLTDSARADPYNTAQRREVSVTAWYPTLATGALAPYLSYVTATANTMAADDAYGFDGLAFYLNRSSTMYPEIDTVLTAAVKNAVVRTDLGLLPVFVISPAFGTPGTFYSLLAAELASRGFVVLVLSCTWESVCTEIPTGVDGQSGAAATDQTALTARVGDVNYILGQLAALPNGLGAQLDLTKVAVGGHSYGGYTAMEIAYGRSDVAAAVALDCTCGWSGTSSDPQNRGLPFDQPVLMVSAGIGTVAANDPTWAAFKAQPHGPFYEIEIAGSKHYAMSDICFVDPNTSTFCGTIAPARAVKIVRDYVGDFLDKVLRGGPGSLMAGPSALYPEVTFPA